MVPSDRALATSYRLSIVTMSPCAAIWLQFLMQCFNLLGPLSPYLRNGRPFLATAGLLVLLRDLLSLPVSHYSVWGVISVISAMHNLDSSDGVSRLCTARASRQNTPPITAMK